MFGIGLVGLGRCHQTKYQAKIPSWTSAWVKWNELSYLLVCLKPHQSPVQEFALAGETVATSGKSTLQHEVTTKWWVDCSHQDQTVDTTSTATYFSFVAV